MQLFIFVCTVTLIQNKQTSLCLLCLSRISNDEVKKDERLKEMMRCQAQQQSWTYVSISKQMFVCLLMKAQSSVSSPAVCYRWSAGGTACVVNIPLWLIMSFQRDGISAS